MRVKFDEKGNKMVRPRTCVSVAYGADRRRHNSRPINIVLDDVSAIRVVSGVLLHLFLLISGLDDCVWLLHYLNPCTFSWPGVQLAIKLQNRWELDTYVQMVDREGRCWHTLLHGPVRTNIYKSFKTRKDPLHKYSESTLASFLFWFKPTLTKE